jgi:hypothetical protein
MELEGLGLGLVRKLAGEQGSVQHERSAQVRGEVGYHTAASFDFFKGNAVRRYFGVRRFVGFKKAI